MFSKLRVIQGIVLYFIFICLFCKGDDLYFNYKTKVVKFKYNTRKNTVEYKVCRTYRIVLVHLCNRAFFYLRMTKKEYKNTLYINYKVFNIDKNACKTVKVRVPPQYGFIKESVDQIVVNCYARGPIDESPDMNPKDYQFYDKIVVYPYKNRDLMIYEQTENQNEFKLLDWMKDVYWQSINHGDNKVFVISVPARKDLSVSMNKINRKNIFQNAKCEKLQKMCTLLYGRQTYSDKFIVDTETKNFKCKPEYQNVLFPNGMIIFNETYICAGFLANEDPPVQTEKYRLMPGSGKNDVILVIYNDETNIVMAVELIDNLHKDYIDLMFPPKYVNLKLPSE